MKPIALMIAVAVSALAGCASLPGGANDPAASNQAAQTGPAGAATPVAPKMAEVQDVHRKMMASTTPEERAAMMNDHKLVVPVEAPTPTQNGKTTMAAGQSPVAEARQPDQQMLLMQQMHRKMQTAKTPKERAAFKREFMKTVQANTSTTGGMKGAMPMQQGNGAMAGSTLLAEHNALLRRMDMMEAMVHMLIMDQDARKPAARKRK
jgi:hypothetical protein